MHDTQGNYIGPALQWEDITEQQDGQRQVESLIQRAISGELNERIDTSVYSGFMKELGDGINSLLDTMVEPIGQCIDVMSRVADGDLNTNMSENKGEFGRLSDAVNTSIVNLRNMVEKITQSSARVATASTEIAEGNNDLSQRVEAQASNLEETAASMEQMTATGGKMPIMPKAPILLLKMRPRKPVKVVMWLGKRYQRCLRSIMRARKSPILLGLLTKLLSVQTCWHLMLPLKRLVPESKVVALR